MGVEVDDIRPDYVIMGEQNYYSKSQIRTAVNLVRAGRIFELIFPDDLASFESRGETSWN